MPDFLIGDCIFEVGGVEGLGAAERKEQRISGQRIPAFSGKGNSAVRLRFFVLKDDQLSFSHLTSRNFIICSF